MKLSNLKSFHTFLMLFTILFGFCTDKSNDYLDDLKTGDRETLSLILLKAGKNSDQLESALSSCPSDQIEGLLFLLKYMPERDLKSLSSEFLLENIDYSYRVMNEVKWGGRIPNEIFLNYILPYSNLHERRDDWRKDFYTKFLPLVRGLDSPSEAVLKLNNDIWDIINVEYSTKRPKADQSPYESIDAGLASCTGLSILLIDACRSVGIPARFVGVPLWKDQSGNHSWIEIWDDGWHYLGAAEQSPLNETWFGERAKSSDDSEWKYSIYAASYKKTDIVFPPLFDSTATYIFADIVTDRYSETVKDDGKIVLGIRLFDRPEGSRVKGEISLYSSGDLLASGETRDEKYDFNDFLIFKVLPGLKYEIRAEHNGKIRIEEITLKSEKYHFFNINMQD